jgi:hypothetical protein
MYRSLISCAVASALELTSLGPVSGQPVCRPQLSVTDVQFSEMIPPTLERKWSATVMVDASRCASNASGHFDLGISRLKETGYEIVFRKQFIWIAPSVKIGVDFWADEAVERYWIENVTPCVCVD